ncbi:unnamed protein product [Haemonchus placei]|uniref:DPPIV_N domain-containing protein n=1 Tax=Haemonchus placei TaxID=6290 RepID=A0A158QKU9_HAEPC|nr:unnamed protein product [Haemonchus placei]
MLWGLLFAPRIKLFYLLKFQPMIGRQTSCLNQCLAQISSSRFPDFVGLIRFAFRLFQKTFFHFITHSTKIQRNVFCRAAAPSVEFSLMCERQRATVVSGVTDYVVDKDGSTLMLTTGEQHFRYVNGSLLPLATGSVANDSIASSGFVFDTQFCPSDSQLVSYVLNKQVHVERDGVLIYRTTCSNPNISNGVPPFIAQEELDRFQAVWWSPTSTRLLYERVDETMVRSLMFVCPGREPQAPMKYPVAGTDNAVTELRLIVVNGNTTPLKMKFPWVEYIARVGFLNDGKTVWLQVMNRTQSQAALILLPESDFEGFSATGPIREACVMKDEISNAWINCAHVRKCYRGEVVNLQERVVTQGDFSVCKSTSVVIDENRRLVYYIANVRHPTEWNVCVSSYDETSNEVRRLTESGSSFKGERACHHLCLLPSDGFVCWMTSLSQPPQCRFYALAFSDNSTLPTATLVAQVSYCFCNHSIIGRTWALPYLLLLDQKAGLYLEKSPFFFVNRARFQYQNMSKNHSFCLRSSRIPACPQSFGDYDVTLGSQDCSRSFC